MPNWPIDLISCDSASSSDDEREGRPVTKTVRSESAVVVAVHIAAAAAAAAVAPVAVAPLSLAAEDAAARAPPPALPAEVRLLHYCDYLLFTPFFLECKKIIIVYYFMTRR